MSSYHKEVRAVIESIDALHKAMDADQQPYSFSDYPSAMIEIIRSLLSTDFEKADLYHHGMWVGVEEWKEIFDKNHAKYGGPK